MRGVGEDCFCHGDCVGDFCFCDLFLSPVSVDDVIRPAFDCDMSDCAIRIVDWVLRVAKEETSWGRVVDRYVSSEVALVDRVAWQVYSDLAEDYLREGGATKFVWRISGGAVSLIRFSFVLPGIADNHFVDVWKRFNASVKSDDFEKPWGKLCGNENAS